MGGVGPGAVQVPVVCRYELHAVRLTADATAFGCRAADSFGCLLAASFARSLTSIGGSTRRSDNGVLVIIHGLARPTDLSSANLHAHAHAHAQTCNIDANI